MPRFLLTLLAAMLIGFPLHAETPAQNACDDFHHLLKKVPHNSLENTRGTFKSLADEKPTTGCQVRFTTSETLLSGKKVPSFAADEDTELYRLGWRVNNSLSADGPGTSLTAIEREKVACLILSDQPAYLDERTGTIVQSKTLAITIQCRDQ